MKASELIERLQEAVEEYGDRSVALFAWDGEHWDTGKVRLANIVVSLVSLTEPMHDQPTLRLFGLIPLEERRKKMSKPKVWEIARLQKQLNEVGDAAYSLHCSIHGLAHVHGDSDFTNWAGQGVETVREIIEAIKGATEDSPITLLKSLSPLPSFEESGD